tara:strand:+ start:1783 stop:2025 length:243 start_codon:yes stop_codon:yes gene_type:complete
MGKLADFTMNDLMLMIGACGIALSGVLTILWRSKCSNIKFCCLSCDRDVKAVVAAEALEKGLKITKSKEPEAREPEVERP